MNRAIRLFGGVTAALLGALALVTLIAGPAAASRRNHDDRCTLFASQLSAEQIAAAVDTALAVSPGIVVRVALETGIDAGGAKVPFLVVAIRDDAEQIHRLYFDGETGAEILPPPPLVSFNEASTTALDAATARHGSAQLLGGRLTNRVLNPIYVMRLLVDRDDVVRVSVDALNGAIVASDDDRNRRGKGKGKRRGRRGKGRDGSGSDCDDDHDDDGDDDYDDDELDDLDDDSDDDDSDDDDDDDDDSDDDDSDDDDDDEDSDDDDS